MHLPELLTVTKNDIHVLVKRLKLADEGARVLEGKRYELDECICNALHFKLEPTLRLPGE